MKMGCKQRGEAFPPGRLARETTKRAVRNGTFRIVLALIGAVILAGFGVSAGAIAQDDSYQIGPQDKLEISVWREDGLQKEVLVRPDGGISFPLAGDIHVAGKTPREVQEEITRRIRKYIPDAVVTVSVLEVSGYRIYVIGKVNNPGQFVVGRYVDVMQALTLAGGLTPYASESDIKIIRNVGGHQKVYPFRYSAVKRGENLEQNILLKSGDTVVVP